MMMSAAAILMLVTAPVWAQVAKNASLTTTGGPPRVAAPIAQGTFTGLEKRFDQRFAEMFPAGDAVDLLGNTRGVYLDGYGAVFTAEISLVVTPTTNPFRTKIPPELAARVRQKKLERLPALKTVMKEMMKNMAATFIQLPYDQKMVLIVRFYYEPWEDLNGMPSQVLMRADRKAVLAGDIQVEEK